MFLILAVLIIFDIFFMTVAKLFLPVEIVEIVVVVVVVIVVVVVHHGDHIEDSVDGNDSKSHEAENTE
jgi:hypothetical protein